jgi:hypothetical protein
MPTWPIFLTWSGEQVSRPSATPSVGVFQLLTVNYHLQIAVENAANLDRVVEFFEGTAYAPRPADERTVTLTPPDRISADLARREIQIYLRVLGRVHPGVSAKLLG